MHIYELNGKQPRIHKTARILDGAVIAGDVVVGPDVLISWNAVVYAEQAPLEIGRGACIGDGALVHAKENLVRIGDFALIGHAAQICDATVENHAMVGIGAVVVDGACVAEASMLAGGSFLRSEDARTTSGMVWAGRPAKESSPWKKDNTGVEERAHQRLSFFDTLRRIELQHSQFE